MSTMRESIMLAAPDRAGTEHYFSRPQTCRYCGGSGHFAPYGPDDKASICPDCHGAGKWWQSSILHGCPPAVVINPAKTEQCNDTELANTTALYEHSALHGDRDTCQPDPGQ